MSRSVKGSLTVEAAIILPLLLGLLGLVMSSGIQMYTECRDTAVSILEEPDLDIVKTFYRWQEIGDIVGDED